MRRGRIRNLFGLLAMLTALGMTVSCAAQERCSIAEVYAQAQEMGGRWQECYQLAGRAIEIDCPVIVPDVDKMPLLTVERLKPARAAFDAVAASGKMIRPKNPMFLLPAENGDTLTVRFATNGAGMTDDYDRCQEVWIQQGEYDLIRSDEPVRGYRIVSEHGYAWAFPADEPLADGNNRTIRDGEAFLRGWMEKYYPDEQIDVQLHTADIYSLRRTQDIQAGKTSRETGTDIYEGGYVLSYEQLLEGIPLFSPISAYAVNTAGTPRGVSAERRLRALCQGARNASARIDLRFKNESWFYALIMASRVREVRHADVPLAPLEDVMAGLERKIEEGRIVDVLALRLGYVLYSDPDTADWAWAVPCWLADCMTAEQDMVKIADAEDTAFWNRWTFASVPVNAQTAQVIYYGDPTEEIYALPRIQTW